MKIFSIPFKNSIDESGCEEAPLKILEDAGISMFKEISLEKKNLKEDLEKIYETAKENFAAKETCLFIGGDQSITFPLASAFIEEYSDAALIVFDAHADSEDPSHEPTNEEWLRALIESGLDSKNIILIGTRKVWVSEKEFLEKSKMKIFSDFEDVEAVADYITEKTIKKSIYVSIDIDSIDPAFAPGTNSIEPNGLTSKEFFYLLRRILKTRSVKALDLTEVNSKKDEKYDFRTIKIASKVIQEFASFK